MSAHDSVIWEHGSILGNQVVESIKELLEEKHLYQSSKVALDIPLVDLSAFNSAMRSYLENELAKLPGGFWFISDKADKTPPLSVGFGIHFETPDVKLFCETCQRTEAFNSVSSLDVSVRGSLEESLSSTGEIVQIFALSFRCQSCKGPPEVFLIRRAGNRLTLSGRAPIEHIEVPSTIPKSIYRWYSGAVVAHQSGQTLAGLFLLRTLIEQWVRVVTQATQDTAADAAIEAYMDGLPSDFRARFPSLRELYSEISADIHAAKGASDLFESALERIARHFEARRLYEL